MPVPIEIQGIQIFTRHPARLACARGPDRIASFLSTQDSSEIPIIAPFPPCGENCAMMGTSSLPTATQSSPALMAGEAAACGGTSWAHSWGPGDSGIYSVGRSQTGKPLFCKAFRYFLCPAGGCFPLQYGNAFDKPFHTVCAGLLHPACHMTAYIQTEKPICIVAPARGSNNYCFKRQGGS